MRRTCCVALSVFFINSVLCFIYAQQPPAKKKKAPATQPAPPPAPSSAADFIKAAKESLNKQDYANAEIQARKANEAADAENADEKNAKKLLEIILIHKATSLALEARKALDAADYSKSEAKAREALEVAPLESKPAKMAEALLGENAAIQTQNASLTEAERLSSEGKFSEAATITNTVLTSAKDAKVIQRAQNVLAQTHPGFWTKLYYHYVQAVGWLLLDIILVAIGIYLLYRFLKWLRSKWTEAHNRSYLITGVEDSSNLGIGPLVIDSLNRWGAERAPTSVGLLRLDAPQFPLAPRLEAVNLDLDFTPVLEAVQFQVAGVSVSGLAGIIKPFSKWYKAGRPWIKGAALASDTHLSLYLTRRNSNGKTDTVATSIEKTQPNAATYIAEAVSYKMYYLIAKDSSISEAEYADKLRQGLKLLGQYISANKQEKLLEAYQAFHSVRSESPVFEEAYLYEGIALDLLERHEEAIQRFEYLKQPEHTPDDELRQKATYNEAIAHFRKYTREELETAIQILQDMLQPDPSVDDLVATPIKALALAAKANAIAHKPIFWQEFIFNNFNRDDEQVILQRKREGRARVQGWITEVEEIAAKLRLVLQGARNDERWDSLTRQQLEWAIENALGNLYLNYAKSYLHRPHLIGANEEEDRLRYLGAALNAFQNCEIILPPGVETLTNLATVLLELSRGAEARSYLDRTIALNQDYEYAYYRMAQTWEKENRADKVVEVLRKFASKKQASIPGFRAIYQKYAADLARQP